MWNKSIDNFIKSQGFKRSVADPCVHHKIEEGLIITIYVEDILIFGGKKNIESIKNKFKYNFDIKDLGEIRNILSIRVTKDQTTVRLDQSIYATEILREMNMLDAKGVSTPLAIGEK
ncbi:hypothetical protein JTB14_005194 [Gonioctena quinquepunctata]|nr:hypothetical protein JTB14_005194 [Gonioctena quinquepunctata]